MAQAAVAAWLGGSAQQCQFSIASSSRHTPLDTVKSHMAVSYNLGLLCVGVLVIRAHIGMFYHFFFLKSKGGAGF